MPKERQSNKPVIKVSLLPKWTEDQYRDFHNHLVAAATDESLGWPVKSERDIFIRFPKDCMEYGLGEELLVEVSVPRSFYKGSLGNDRLTGKLSHTIGGAVLEKFPKAFVQCDVKYVGGRADLDGASWNSTERE